MTSPPTKVASRSTIPSVSFVILVIVATVISISRDIISLDKPVKKSVVAPNHKADGSIVEHDEHTLKNEQQYRRRQLWEGLEDEWEEDDDDEVGEDIPVLDEEAEEEDEWEDDDDEEDYEKSNTWMNAAAVEIDSGDNIDEWSDDELDEEYIAEDGIEDNFDEDYEEKMCDPEVMLQSNADRCDKIWDNVCLAEDGDELCAWIFGWSDDESFNDYDDDEDEDWYNSEDEEDEVELDSFEEEEEWRARNLRG